MRSLAEAPYTVDGVKSWVECLHEKIETPAPDVIFYHFHEYIELLFALSPGAVVHINGDPCPLQPGDLAVINSSVPHTVTYTQKTDYLCIKFSPHILYAQGQSLLEYNYLLPFLSENTRQNVFRRGSLQAAAPLLDEIMREWQEKRSGCDLIIRADILRIFADIFRLWEKEGVSLPAAQPTEPIRRALALLTRDFATATARDAAAAAGISYNHFSTCFKRQVGIGLNEYLTVLRLREAERLLVTTEKSVTEIALAVGFSSTSHFIARFGAAHGITPKQFRLRLGL